MCIRDSATTAVVACEASGGLEHDVVSILTQAGHRVRIVDAGQVRHFARSFGRKAKTDQIDAVMIARYATTIEGRITVPDAPRKALIDLLSVRDLLVDQTVVLRNCARHVTEPQAGDSLAKTCLLYTSPS